MRALSCFALVALLLSPAPVHAQIAPPPWYPPPPPYGSVPVVIQGDRPGLRFTLSRSERLPPFARCRGDCTVFVMPREYWLTVGATRDTFQGSRMVEVDRPRRILVMPASRGGGRGGTLGIVGFSLLAGGVGAIGYGLLSSADETGTWVVAGAGAVAAGLVISIVAGSRSEPSDPKIRIEPLD